MPLPHTPSILIAAPPTLHREGLLNTLRGRWPGASFTLITEPGQLPVLLRQRAYTLLVVDGCWLRRPLSALLAQLQTLRQRQPVLLLTGTRLPPRDCRAQLGPGPHALLSHYAPPATLVGTVAPWLDGSAGGTAAAPAPLPHRLAPAVTGFSRRELEVLRLVVADCTNQQIADHLSVSVRTVETHRRALLQKSGAHTVVGLVVLAVRQGWVDA